MKTPLHHFKECYLCKKLRLTHVIHGSRFGWLGSGINDINGQEIFEGDIVKFGEHDLKGVIVFKDGMFQIAHGDKFTILGKCKDFVAVEVIGHIEEAES